MMTVSPRVYPVEHSVYLADLQYSRQNRPIGTAVRAVLIFQRVRYLSSVRLAVMLRVD